MTVDRHYTPESISAKLLLGVNGKLRGKSAVIADFSAGDGRLLIEASKLFRAARFIAVDIDVKAINGLRSLQPSWEVARCDFISQRSRNHCKILKRHIEKVSLAVLNPPFTSKRCVEVRMDDGSLISCSKAMAFMLIATFYLKRTGEIRAILPAGCLSNRRDAEARRFLAERGRLQQTGRNSENAFSGCRVKTVIVKYVLLHKIRYSSEYQKPLARNQKTDMVGPKVLLDRGRTPMHAFAKGTATRGIPLVHTTDLQNRKIIYPSRYTADTKTAISGPAILLPRVGRPNQQKIAFFERGRIVLSDCVYALRCPSVASAKRLLVELHGNWGSFKRAYSGTCAPHLTIDKLSTRVKNIGYGVLVRGGIHS